MQILIYRGVSGIAKGRSKGTGNREQGTGMAADAIVKAFPSDRRERFRGIERPENGIVRRFQRDGAGRPAVGGFR